MRPVQLVIHDVSVDRLALRVPDVIEECLVVVHRVISVRRHHQRLVHLPSRCARHQVWRRLVTALLLAEQERLGVGHAHGVARAEDAHHDGRARPWCAHRHEAAHEAVLPLLRLSTQEVPEHQSALTVAEQKHLALATRRVRLFNQVSQTNVVRLVRRRRKAEVVGSSSQCHIALVPPTHKT